MHCRPLTRKTRAALILLCLVLLAPFFALTPARAEEPAGKVVRVGWYESPFNTIDSNGRRSGYAYDYQQKIAAYTGWTYEYVEDSWPNLMEMLKAGKIDLMSDVSYTGERAEQMLFPSYSMGTEEYYIFVAPGNTSINRDNPATLNGKKIGVNAGSIQITFYNEWAAQNGVEATLIEMTESVSDSLAMLASGKLDAYISLDAYSDPDSSVPVFRIGLSDFYFAVKKDRADLLVELNAAMSRIQDENRFYHSQLYEKYLRTSGANLYLSTGEKYWLENHGKIRVGYQDNYLAFCAADKDGKLTGALKDYLEYASTCLQNATLEFEAVAYPTAAEALEALSRGEVDCIFPSNLTDYEAEEAGVLMTPAIMQTEMYAIIRSIDQREFFEKKEPLVAVNEGNTNYEMFLEDHFPTWKPVFFRDTDECLKAIATDKADCILISNYRYNNIAKLCERYRLTAVSTGEHIDYCFAVEKGNVSLYSILSKVIAVVPDSTVNAALSYYSAIDAKVTFRDLLLDNIFIVIAVILAILLLIVSLILWSNREKKKATEGQELISAAETDGISGLYTRNFFQIYTERLFREHPDQPMDAAALNIGQFHAVNALHGREFGDQVLGIVGKEILAFLEENEGIGSRGEADQFYFCCRQTGSYQAFFDELQKRLDHFSPNANIRLRMGVMPWQEGLEPVQMFDRARTACALARDRRREGLVIYDEKLRDREAYEQKLLNDLRRAIMDREFEVYYQPKYDILSGSSKPVGAEALVRWNHPELGLIPPCDFIPLFEKNGQISIVDRYVCREVAGQIARWREQYGVIFPVSVNLSRIDLFDPMLEEDLDDLLIEHRLLHSALNLEVTESAFTENEGEILEVIQQLRNKGFKVEMDDFGSGYSSLNMLSTIQVDILKMDRGFILNMEQNEKTQHLVKLVLDLAKNLNIPVIAEGVETEKQLELLKKNGCPMVQGYYFSRPLPAAEFEEKILSSL